MAVDAQIREMNHRFRNQLQSILNLMEIQSARSGPGPVAEAMRQCVGRVQTIAAVHGLLSEENSPDHIALGKYLGRLLDGVRKLWGEGRDITFKLDVPADLEVAQEKACHIGLIVNELLTNAFKHAFPAEHSQPDKYVEVSAVRKDADLLITVRDNGKGLPGGEVPHSTGGLKIVAALLANLKGSIGTQPGPGTTLVIKMPAQ